MKNCQKLGPVLLNTDEKYVHLGYKILGSNAIIKENLNFLSTWLLLEYCLHNFEYPNLIHHNQSHANP